MDTFGKKMSSLRKERKMTQDELAKLLRTSISVIGRYERDEMTPSIGVAKKIAELLHTTVGYLLGESEAADLFKDPDMLERLNDIVELPAKEKEALLMSVDAFIRDFKTRKAHKR